MFLILWRLTVGCQIRFGSYQHLLLSQVTLPLLRTQSAKNEHKGPSAGGQDDGQRAPQGMAQDLQLHLAMGLKSGDPGAAVGAALELGCLGGDSCRTPAKSCCRNSAFWE